ncbi:phosphoribosyltransferase-like protein [Cercophora newfieldiana]|uniref:Phosphoribosyltransferase-like protein n=1 Tax=Cercophora newfieldiana TaxID=92897 RepID=A0AA39YKY6_9PEZI|nr:phosphoribosyltransferase-like protein [Cercophora newfieldiana]
MVRNIAVIGGNSHPAFVDSLCTRLGVPPSRRVLNKFSSGETRCEIEDSVRGKDVYIVQSFGIATDSDTAPRISGPNDYFVELCIMISACKTGSAQRVTAVLPLFPYSRQPDLPYAKAGAPLSVSAAKGGGEKADYTFESVPATPGANIPRTEGLEEGVDVVDVMMTRASLGGGSGKGGGEEAVVMPSATISAGGGTGSQQGDKAQYTTHDYKSPAFMMAMQSRTGYKQWMAQAGSLVADLLTCAGADRILTCDLHESTYQGFFDIPVDNLYARPLLKQYIQHHIENYKDAVIVSPDAGGAKRATAIADSLGLAFALIHKERRPTRITDRQKATMMLVGTVANRVCILVDDLADTANTITRAAKLLKREGATAVHALLTHGVLSGDAISRINASALDRVIVTNTVAQDRDRRVACPKLEVLDVSGMFAEAIRRVHHGESISVLFQYD